MISLDEFEHQISSFEKDQGGLDLEKLASLERSLASKSKYMPKRTFSFLLSRIDAMKKSINSPSASSLSVDFTPGLAVGFVPGLSEPIKQFNPIDNFIEGLCAAIVERPECHDSFTIRNCLNSKIKIGPCKGAVFIEGCHGCELVVCGHQVRLIDCRSLKLSLYTATAVIYENCQEIIFAEAASWYEAYEADKQAAGLDLPNNFENRIDFTGF